MKKLIFLLILSIFMAACANNDTGLYPATVAPEVMKKLDSDESKLDFSLPEAQRTTTVAADSTNSVSDTQSPTKFEFKSPRATTDLKNNQVVFQVDLAWGDRTETVILSGYLDGNWTANLYDLEQKSLKKNRLRGVAVCLDFVKCEQIAIDIYYRQNNVLKRIQFSPPNVVFTNPESTSQNEKTDEPTVATEPLTPDIDRVEKEKPTSNPIVADEAHSEANDETGGEFVGRKDFTLDLTALVNLPANPSEDTRDLKTVAEHTVEEDTKNPPPPVKTADQEAMEQSAPNHRPPVNIDDVKILAPLLGTTKTENDSLLLFAQSRPVELKLGGVAVKSVVNGSLENASKLEDIGPGFRRLDRSRQTMFGAGIAINLIRKVAKYFTENLYKETPIWISDIALEKGGPMQAVYGSSAHASHRNGLDMDIPFLNAKGEVISALQDNGKMDANFDYQRQFDFWKLVVSQQIVSKDNKPTSIVNLIFVNSSIKKAFCKWAKDKDMLKDPLNREVLMRVWPETEHIKHFHIRLKCSPYYIRCQDRIEPSSVGC